MPKVPALRTPITTHEEAQREHPQTKYDPRYDEQAYKLCLLTGGTNDVLGEFFGVDPDTIRNWQRLFPTFGEACSRGKEQADFAVVEAAYKRATGYEATSERAILTKDANGSTHVEVVQITEEVPADPQLVQYWLNNRQRRHWRSPMRIDVNAAPGQLEDKHELSREELEQKLRERGLPTTILED